VLLFKLTQKYLKFVFNKVGSDFNNNFDDVYRRNFKILRSQQDFIQDASRKSSIDAPIRQLIEDINTSDAYFTTSSCSGRFIAFCQDEVHLKKNCEWIRVTHEILSANEVEQFVNNIQKKNNSKLSNY
jgi:tRNA(Phe) wybutosine-synthesizing methylase Tyw3